MQRSVAIFAALSAVALGIVVWVGESSGDFIETIDETRVGSEIGPDEQQTVLTLTGLELPPSTEYHAYHFFSSLDQQLKVLVSLDAKDVEAFLTQSRLAQATWVPAANLPTATSDLADWPSSWGEPTVSGRRTSLIPTPGRQLDVALGETSADTQPLLITWSTY